MSVARQNFTVYQGADFRRAMVFRDETSTLMDLTGYTFRGQARTTHASDDIEFSFTITPRTQSGGDLGYVDLHLPDTSTESLEITKRTTYVYDIEWVSPSGDVRRIMEGTVEVYPEVTR